jgi:uncharacterized protein YigE (DUF2233 family)
MKPSYFYKLLLVVLLTASSAPDTAAQNFDSYVATAEKVSFYYKHNGSPIRTLPALGALHPEIRFAMNIQMFAGGRGGSYYPVGLYIENGKLLNRLVRVNNPRVNFGMQPQCVFAITHGGKAILVPLDAVATNDYKWAVELAPMVVIKGAVNPKLTRSDSRYIRNGVGILKDGRILFAISREPVTFQEFAAYFLSRGCTEAAYVDGVVSESWRRGEKPDYAGPFAVMAGVR